MNITNRLVAVAIVVLISSIEGRNLPTQSPEIIPNERRLDSAFTKGPDPTPLPTNYPTKRPTRKPTKSPTQSPTQPAPINTNVPTETPPPPCGTITKSDGSNLLLGPYDETIPWDKYRFDKNNGNHHWFYRHAYWPSYLYGFKLTHKCEYQYKAPETNMTFVSVRDVNVWFEQAAIKFARPNNVAYKVSDDNIVFSGWTVPQLSDLNKHPDNCPEAYCIEVSGTAIVRRSDNTNGNTTDPKLLYAFSDQSAWNDFRVFVDRAIRWRDKQKIFLSNHFLQCGAEPFCKDEDNPFDAVNVQATCYVDERCGERVYMIAYASDYPQNQKATWASTGTTEVMEWFDECALAMYGCSETSSSNKSMFQGTRWGNNRYKKYPRVFTFDTWNNDSFVYGLGGDKYWGFPTSNSNSLPHISWTCPTQDHRNELETFGQYVAEAEFMRDSGIGLLLPDLPCETEDPVPPVPPVVTQTGPTCNSIQGHVLCFETPSGTCYAQTLGADCENLIFFRTNGTYTQTYAYWDMPLWNDDCIADIGCWREPGWAPINGHLTYRGRPNPVPYYTSDIGWRFSLTNRRNNGYDAMQGKYKRAYFNCETWENAYGAKNFTEAVADRHSHWGNSYGDIYNQRKCSESPSLAPSVAPTTSNEPSEAPSNAPTLCGETYLTSESLNIALVLDLSFSTYEKTFSATDPVGDLNGDGKANTILDAQVAAVQELLINIHESPNLDNNNCEIELISFETDAVSHGVWNPLSNGNDGFNPTLMQYVKDNLWAPTSGSEVFSTNNGFTNFDAALDVAVDYFQNTATPGRTNLLVFLSDGEPNVRGDGDNEGYCSDTTVFWNGDGSTLQCSDLQLAPGQRHEFCRGNDPNCVGFEPYQDCVRGPNECFNADAVIQYDSEIAALTELGVERLSIGVGNESVIDWGSALWTIDNNPAKYLGVLPLRALTLEDLKEYLSNLCILNTDPPTKSPSKAPSSPPSISTEPSMGPSISPSAFPSVSFNPTPSETLSMLPSISPTVSLAPTVSNEPTRFCPELTDEDIASMPNGTYPYAEMRFCLRSSYGYRYGVGNTFQEVNFIESLIRIRFDLSAGFCVASFNVDPKERLETTVQGESYGLTAWLCDLETNQTWSNPNRTVPGDIDSTFLADAPDESTASYFNQGSLITVCVAPDDEGYENQRVMDRIASFNWKRNDLNNTAPGLPIEDRLGNPAQLFQQAIADAAPSENGLTSYSGVDCFGAEYCHFSSILFADFYISTGVVTGDGSAVMRFRPPPQNRDRLLLLGDGDESGNKRRLQLQEDEDSAESSFDVAVRVVASGENPFGLETAGSAVRGLTTTALLSSLTLSGILFWTVVN